MAKFSTLVDKDGNIIYPQTSIKQVYIDENTTMNNKIETIESSISQVGGIPSGLICMWSGSEIPSGWNLCDGTNGTPDLRDRFIVGSGSEYTIGETGGEKEHTLTTDEMPSHSHNLTYQVPASGSSVISIKTLGVSTSSTGSTIDADQIVRYGTTDSSVKSRSTVSYDIISSTGGARLTKTVHLIMH